jgi:nibrin
MSKKNVDSIVLQVREKLESSDIKISTDFEGGYTTHVVATKRNAPPVLEGLVAGCFIVTDEYINAIVQACTPNINSNKAPLEIDFNGNWPDPMLHVPPTSKEPTPRSSDYLAPKVDRANVFANFTFVFCSGNQMESLGQPINRGGGKAVLYEAYEDGVSKPEELAAFVRKVAGQQGTSDLSTAKGVRSVIIVRIQVMEPNSEWKTRFIQETDLILGQRSIAQNEFLDVILTCNTSGLKTPLEEVQIPSSAPGGK